MFRLHKKTFDTEPKQCHIDKMISCLSFLFTPSTNFVKAQGSLRNSWARKWEDVFGCYCHCFRSSSSRLGNLTSSDYLCRCFLLVSRISHIASHRILFEDLSHFVLICPPSNHILIYVLLWGMCTWRGRLELSGMVYIFILQTIVAEGGRLQLL